MLKGAAEAASAELRMRKGPERRIFFEREERWAEWKVCGWVERVVGNGERLGEGGLYE